MSKPDPRKFRVVGLYLPVDIIRRVARVLGYRKRSEMFRSVIIRWVEKEEKRLGK